jgi:hypothetical protein
MHPRNPAIPRSFGIAVALLFSLAAPFPAGARSTGDYNGDTKVDVQDAVAMMRSAVHLSEPTQEELARGDVISNDQLDINDVIRALQIAVQIVPPVQDTDPSALGAIEGYVFLNASGAVILDDQPTPPAGTTPLAQAAVSVVGSKPVFLTDSTGHFIIDGIHAGARQLHVVPSSGAPLDVPVTVISRATVRVGPPPVSRNDAIQAAKQALGDKNHQDSTFIMATQNPLPAGVLIDPALGNDNGDPDVTQEIALTSPQWLVYADLESALRFQHPVVYLLVDAATGALTAHDATAWPMINGQGFYQSSLKNLASQDLIQAPPSQPVTTTRFSRDEAIYRAFDHVPGCDHATTYALLIPGSDESAMNGDVSHVKNMFGHGGIPPALVWEHKPPTEHPVEDVAAKFKEICSRATECDTIFLFISSHGTRGGAAKLDSTAVNKDGSPVDFESLTAAYFNFKECKACHIIIIIDSCYSGRMLDQFKTMLTPLTGKKAVVMSSADAAHESVAYGSWDPRGKTGGAFTDAFTDAFSKMAEGGKDVSLSEAFTAADVDLAGTVIVSAAREQNPQFWERKLAPGETCNGTQVSFNLQPNPVNVAATFIHQTGECPGLPKTFDDQLTIGVDGTTITLTQPSSGVVSTGTMDANGSFTVTGPSRTYSGTIDSTGAGTMSHSYTDPSGCTSNWQVLLSPTPRISGLREHFNGQTFTTEYQLHGITADGSTPTYKWEIIYPGDPCGHLVDPDGTGPNNGYFHGPVPGLPDGCPEDFEFKVKIKVTITQADGKSSTCTFNARQWEEQGMLTPPPCE